MDKLNLLTRSALLALLAGLGTACQQPTAAVSPPGTVPVASPLPAANGAVQSAPAAAAAAAPAQNPEDSIPRVPVAEAKAAIDSGKAIIIDVRGPDAYKAAHVKGALEHGLSRLEQGDFKDLPKDKRIIAYCS
ncbi:MAG: rhodanese-like domain-containing protein [Acidobacteria bacterium]|nr:rhodanese-like domain-containing protein [Acidobacteriota bacterium]MBI3424773.1 rhodanese-like domain-containing protein [Acidobacteriota bacterium]